MGIPSAVATGIGTAVQAGQAINSGVKGNRAQRQYDQDMGAQRDLLGGLVTTGQDMVNQVMGGYGQFANPALGNQVLDMGQGAAAGIADVNRSTADALGNQGLAGQAAGLLQGGYQNNVGIPQAGAQMQFTAPGMDQYNFQAPQQLANQFTQNALQAGNNARLAAREQVGAQTQQMQAGLNAQLAAQGLSPNSGAAAAALAQNAMAGTQQLAGLERGIAEMAGQAGLQGAQLDANNLLQLTGMGSQYNMGMNQLGQQSALGAFNANLGAQGQAFGQQLAGAQLQAGIDQSANQFNLGAAGQLAGLQGLQNDVTLQQGALRNAAYTDPLGIMQGIYQSNYLNPQMQGLSQMGQIASGLLSGGIGGLDNLLGRQAEGVKAAGGGKGAATGGALGGLQQMSGGGKGAAVPIPTPNIGVSTGQPVGIGNPGVSVAVNR